MRKSFFLFTISFLFSVACIAQYDFKKVDEWMNTNTDKMGGRAILIVYKDEKVVYTKAVNHLNMQQKFAIKTIADKQGKEPNLSDYTSTTREPIASCSKWLSAALIMTFIDEGKLKLTDTVGKFLPVLSQNWKGGITISECLSHLTGIEPPPLKESLNEMKDAASMDEAISKIAAMPMEGKPGSVFHYSNVGLQIAGAVIEKISGKNFETLFAERIAQPLNMKNTDFGKGKVALPAGGAFSTPDDYMHFLEMILHKGVYNDKRILSEESIAEMQVNLIDKNIRIGYRPSEAGDFGYGFGEWIMETSGLNNLTTAVTSPGLFGSFPWVDDQNKYCAFLMSVYIKTDGRNERYKDLKALVDEAIK
ncbi:MAG: serine hydrolase domain-containing protein [Parafilimonas sp.]